ncbi:Permease for cytosine/purines, uracil, thiamine, allantoin [Saccharopolyspora antimicrobica]|uniref:Permease for cytosine/purines n=1 Tax=Saccharopolyspora antimicrobica TaxID=455193 RepID=A0A1I5FLN9_9PSEU|nr:permease for cytosine/purines [Saccharopolyspora antimicrobica]SFO24698.1 Permease for cytosine/purines, uracil, thiamine, allantoin [Saccharopolyspora antimicrobica]
MGEAPAFKRVETNGVERIPDAERTARPLDLFRLCFGGANTFSTAVLGAFPILFGLSFWQGLAATALGLVAGALVLCPMAVFGTVNGTNNAVSSSAHLGVHGRVVGSFLSLLTAVTFFAISVWSSGDALVGSALIVLANPMSFGAFLGDWSRYIPSTTPRARVVAAALLAQLSTIVPFGFGLITATVIAGSAPEYLAGDAPNYVGGLLAVSPGWYFGPLCLIALIGGLSTGTTALYGTGLDFSSVFPRFSRVRATVLVGVLSIGLIFVGRFGFNLVQSISTFAALIVTCTGPWMVVMILAGVQPAAAGRALLVPPRLELARHDRVAAVGRCRAAVRQHPGPAGRAARRAGGRDGHQPAAVPGARGGRLSRFAPGVPRAPRRVRPGRTPLGALRRHPGTADRGGTRPVIGLEVGSSRPVNEKTADV